IICLFFFSSRRRHTRFSRDWSSDVCSSDLLFSNQFPCVTHHPQPGFSEQDPEKIFGDVCRVIQSCPTDIKSDISFISLSSAMHRSEERRVGKECRSRRWACQGRQKSRDSRH